MTSRVKLNSNWRYFYAANSALFGLLFASYVLDGSIAGIAVGLAGALLLTTLAVRGLIVGVVLDSDCLISRGFVKTRRYERQEIVGISPEVAFEKLLVDVWTPKIALVDGSTFVVRPLAKYGFKGNAPRRVVSWTDQMHAWLTEQRD